MARILCIDYGLKRCGIAVTDPLQIIVSGLETVPTNLLLTFIDNYLLTENVTELVIGLPVHKDGNFTYLKKYIDDFISTFSFNHPEIKVTFADESFTSSQAKSIIFQQGIKKEKRKDKSLVDKVSAVLILQKYLNHI